MWDKDIKDFTDTYIEKLRSGFCKWKLGCASSSRHPRDAVVFLFLVRATHWMNPERAIVLWRWESRWPWAQGDTEELPSLQEHR
jgi:hypothetical protein